LRTQKFYNIGPMSRTSDESGKTLHSGRLRLY